MRMFGIDEVYFLVFALRWTLLLTAIAFIGGGIAGVLLALVRLSDNPLIRVVTSFYVQVVQGLPLLMLLFLCFYGSSLLGFEISPIVAAAVALTIHSSAFLGTIWESSLRAIVPAQWESAWSLALTPMQTLRDVIAPQAIRIALPPTVGFLVQVIKQTSLASVIGFVEVTRAGQLMSNATFEPLKVFLIVAALYFIVCFPLTQLSRWLERRSGPKLSGDLA
uniref:amino acid ABC transporter permease n=1 Tax=Pararhizobium sp. IMCC3301 TaxID=3067904 RepID=UPI0027419C74|nr:amino acid ABC transporter permease [Pararhizobium sp. IMCC3301]